MKRITFDIPPDLTEAEAQRLGALIRRMKRDRALCAYYAERKAERGRGQAYQALLDTAERFGVSPDSARRIMTIRNRHEQ